MRWAPHGLARTLDALRAYAALARQHGARIAAIGTEALRRAPNGADFLGPAAEILGVPVEVIDGAREAALTFRAATSSFPREAQAGAMVVVDIGGGSTEIVVSDRGRVTWSRSLPLGAVRLTEAHVRHDPPRPVEVDAITREIDERRFRRRPGWPGTSRPTGRRSLVGVAGTVTSLAAMALRLPTYDPARVHGYELGAAALDAEVERLRAADQTEREHFVGLDPKRADVILAGALILRRIAAGARASSILVSDRGIRWGLLKSSKSRRAARARGPGPLV